MTEAQNKTRTMKLSIPSRRGPQYLLLKTFLKGVGEYAAAQKVFQSYLSPMAGVQDIFLQCIVSLVTFLQVLPITRSFPPDSPPLIITF